MSRANAYRYAASRLSAFLGSALFSVFILAVILTIGPDIEDKWFPVLTDMEVTSVERTDGVVKFTAEAVKQRNCLIDSGDWVLVTPDNRRSAIYVTNSIGRPVGPVNYPVGPLRLGPFTAYIPPGFEDAARIEGLYSYDCHIGWKSRLDFPEVMVPAWERP